MSGALDSESSCAQHNKRIFYFNLTYHCNLDCRFCFSHNTNISNCRPDISPETFHSALSTFNITHGDRIVLNGGEPTEHSAFPSILKAAVSSCAEVVLYTNGTNLCRPAIEGAIHTFPPARMTVPIHGHKVLHDAMTRKPGSWNLAVAGLSNISRFLPPQTLELKFIVTNAMAESSFEICDFLESFLPSLSSLKSIVICGQVNTPKACKSGTIFLPDPTLMEYVEKQILSCAMAFPTKFYDLPLCYCSSSFQNLLTQSVHTNCDIPYDLYFSDSLTTPRLHSFPAVTRPSCKECSGCQLHDCCTSICENYNVSQLFRGVVTRSFE